MPLWAFALIIISAFMHATWNYLSKRSKGGITFVWLFMVVSVVVYAPFAVGVFIFQDSKIGWGGFGFIIGSTVIHLAYTLTLQKGYKIGDLSLVYPVARGTGPMLAALAAIFIYHEQPTIIEFCGIFLVVSSVFILTGGFQIFKRSASVLPFVYGLVVGIMIASYTLWDKGAVSVLLIPPLLYFYGSMMGQLILLTPFVWQRRSEIRKEWRRNKTEAIGIGLLNPLAYLLILTVMIVVPVSHVAPVREISILIGTVMGTRLLSEGFGLRRVVAAGAMVTGVVIVAFS